MLLILCWPPRFWWVFDVSSKLFLPVCHVGVHVCMLLLLSFIFFIFYVQKLDCNVAQYSFFIYCHVVCWESISKILSFIKLGNFWHYFMKYIFFCLIFFLHNLGHQLYICRSIWCYLLSPKVLVSFLSFSLFFYWVISIALYSSYLKLCYVINIKISVNLGNF